MRTNMQHGPRAPCIFVPKIIQKTERREQAWE